MIDTFLLLIVVIIIVLIASVYFLPGPVYRVVMRAERAIAGLKTCELTAGDLEFVYNDSERGVPLVVVHGFSADKDHWTRVARFLTKDFRVIAPDMPGFGDSTRDADRDYTIDAQVAYLLRFVDELGLHQFHLGGNSMGGAIAAVFAVTYPERVQSLWLLAPAGVISEQRSEMEQILSSGGIHPLIPGNLQQWQDTLSFVFVKKPFLPGPFRRYLAKVAVERQALLVQIFQGLVDQTGNGMRHSINELVANIDSPTLIVWGDGDRVLHPAGATVLGELLPDSTVELLPGIGHLPMLEKPRLVADGYLRFQEQLTTTNQRQTAP